MPAYRVNHNYRSSWGQLEAGAVVELDQAVAEWLDRDSPGCISLDVPEPEKPKPAKATKAREA